MKKLYGRLIVFFVGIPAIAVLIIFLPGLHHLAFIAAVCAICTIGTGEMLNLLDRRSIYIERWLVLPLSAFAPITSYLSVAGVVGDTGATALLVAPFALIIARHAISYTDRPFEEALPVVAGSFAAVLYPGFFALFFVRIAALPNPTLSFLAFLSLVFVNDTAAYVFGMLFGKGSRGVSRISPNKSIPGFVAGPLFSIGVALIYHACAPALFGESIVLALAVGVCVGAATIIGDLFESLLKRSADVKDSGIVIPGRGGVLDSVDSVFFAAPVFYLLLSIAS